MGWGGGGLKGWAGGGGAVKVAKGDVKRFLSTHF